ncbi:MAG: heterodisulfide reductase-related iron-sulfur binding cluster [Candidatus Binatus sp.]|uniref:(Fe-S)-binding protein n=1 Tax=Candidatus Binatus sp. TaxID=2811406 RepID=UPI002721E36A|nr:heterodisulfide reductase-related iron-sulfur binding cluster [Candidatus Binatus sp.]MDO8432518.1 heterodisulfide reductase-related iron-sulfur binding cluster [Candidatus Binatus sp.]
MEEPPTSHSQPVRDVCDYDLLFDCVHCGLCAEACPTYVATRREMDSPRGRIYLMKSLAEGKLQLDDDAVRHLDLCLGCRGCETACPSGVHYGQLIEGARAFVERNHRRGVFDRLKRSTVSAIFPYPSRMRAVLAPLIVVDRLGLRPALRAILPRSFRDWLDLLPPLGARHPLAPDLHVASADNAPTVVVHHGCVAQVLANSENLNSERMLAAAGYRVEHLEETVCCGALDLHSGNSARALEFARANVRALKGSGADAIVSAASGCSTAIAEYGELLKHDAELAADARAVAGKVKDLSTLLLAAKWTPVREFRCTVTYHDACHLAHGLGIREAPRKLLASIPGVRLVELTESDLCCGSAGSYNLTEPEMARELGRRKVDNIVATGADYVVLANPGCEFQIAAELKRRNSKTRAIHLADFLALVANNDRIR